MMLVLFSLYPKINAKVKTKLLPIPHAAHNREAITRKADSGWEQEKKIRYFEIRNKKQENQTTINSEAGEFEVDRVQAVNITMDDDSLYFQPDYFGDLVMTGLLYNAGTTSAVFVRVDVDFYDINQNFIGSDFTYVWGGSNVKLTGSGIYTNALGYGDNGFFKAWTFYDYNNVYWYDYTISYETYSHTAANAALTFDGPVYYYNYLDNMDVYGSIMNLSFNYVTYNTYVAFALFDPTDTQVVDVSFEEVDGRTYGASNSAIYPGESEPFDVWFPQAAYGSTSESYISAFEWDEAWYSSYEEKNPPFGTFETPINGSTVASSIPVTGWALDDSGIASVKIYRQQGGNLLYIGSATLVEGARPDVAAAYPQYPNIL